MSWCTFLFFIKCENKNLYFKVDVFFVVIE